jgi:predicted RNA-binding Zn-ribbon protein involved in translation (DUF1610 family)
MNAREAADLSPEEQDQVMRHDLHAGAIVCARCGHAMDATAVVPATCPHCGQTPIDPRMHHDDDSRRHGPDGDRRQQPQ